MSAPVRRDTYGRWPDDDRHKGRRRRDVQAAAARGLRQAGTIAELAGRAGRAMAGDAGGRGVARASARWCPRPTFTSYYGRPMVKPSPWEADIPAYLFLGGLAAGSSLLAAGADLTGRPALRRAGTSGGARRAQPEPWGALVHDLGRPEPLPQHAAGRQADLADVGRHLDPVRLRTVRRAGRGVGAVAAAESRRAGCCRMRSRPGSALAVAGRPAGIGGRAGRPGVASYTAVLLSDTATPSWHDAHRELPFVFVGSARRRGRRSGHDRRAGRPGRSRPADGGRRGAARARRRRSGWRRSMGVTAEPLHQARPAADLRAAQGSQRHAGAAGAAAARRVAADRLAAISGAALMAGSACTRFGIFEAGQESAKDPKYTVVPQRERLDRAQGQPL